MQTRYCTQTLLELSERLLVAKGMPTEKALSTAQVLLRGECFGKTTHGLALLPAYLREIDSGGMALHGEPIVLQDHQACLSWDGCKLPGPWLLEQAINQGIPRARRYGIASVNIQRSHHTACLSAYLQMATEQGLIIQITLTDPGHSSVAPFGGTSAVLTSNPIAFGAPTSADPILIDMSTSLATNAAVARQHACGTVFDYPVLLDNQGNASSDPAVMHTNPAGTILPIGGLEAGHKGFAMGLIAEVMAGCLSGGGRATPSSGWSASVNITLFDPRACAGQSAYLQQVDALVSACHNATPWPGGDGVRLPGEQALKRASACKAMGTPLPAELAQQLNALAVDHQLPALEPCT